MFAVMGTDPNASGIASAGTATSTAESANSLVGSITAQSRRNKIFNERRDGLWKNEPNANAVTRHCTSGSAAM